MLKRLLFFAYGVASYLTFLVTFLYAIAFVGGFAVPRQLDGPLESSLPAALPSNGDACCPNWQTALRPPDFR